MYGDPDPAAGRTKLFALLGALVLLAAIVVAVMFWPSRSVETAEGIEAELQRTPALRDTTQALKTHYPQEYQALLQRMAAAGRRGGRRAASDEAGPAMRAFLASKATAFARAPSRELQRLAGAQLTLVRALQRENVTACAQFVMNGLRSDQGLSAATLALVSRVAVLQIEAASAGDRSGRTPRGEPSQAEFQLWLQRIRAIDPAAATDIESDAIGGVPPDRQCRDGVALHQALAELPAEPAGNLMALLMREAVAQR